jgi:hypothetical protein
MMSLTKLLVLAICAFIVWKLSPATSAGRRTRPRSRRRTLSPPGDGQDPVCGAYVSRHGDIRVRHGDVVLHFCCMNAVNNT